MDKKTSAYIFPQLESLEQELLNKQTQLNCLMKITQAINANVSADKLFDMYTSYLTKEMRVGRLAMFIKKNERWVCQKAINFDITKSTIILSLVLNKVTDFTRVGELSSQDMKLFDYIIPVLHKNFPIAYVLIGRIVPSSDEYDRLKFMITITNIVAVAIENKRLFNRQIEQEKLEKELDLARRVQQMLIPSSLPDTEFYELASIYRPHSNVGGDYFDYYQFPDDKLMLCLADVSGKGIPAAMIMANLQATIKTAMQFFNHLDDLVRHVNDFIVAITKSERIITFFIMIYSPIERKLLYVNAGHNRPLLISESTTSFLEKGCPILGATESLGEIEVGEIEIKEDTLVVMYTDGLTELLNERGEYFDENRLMSFTKEHRQDQLFDFNKKLLNILEEFKGVKAFTDDVAVLTCRIKVEMKG